jgi:replicative DNA helicase
MQFKRLFGNAATAERTDIEEASRLIHDVSAKLRTMTTSASTTAPQTASSILERWTREGPLVRRPSGIAELDDASHGGLVFPWRVMLVGAPSAGKTALYSVIARNLAKAGVRVGILAVDEEPEDLLYRFAQMEGYTQASLDTRDPELLRDVAAKLEGLGLQFYGAETSIERAAAQLHASAGGQLCALFVDSLQVVRSERSGQADGPRATTDAKIAAIREVATKYRMLTVTTSEANRASYRSEEAVRQSDDLAAGKESSGIEFAAQTLIMCRTPKGHPDVIELSVPKNRRARAKFTFYLRLDRDRHELTPCSKPSKDDDAGEQEEAGPDVEARVIERLRSLQGTWEGPVEALAKAICARKTETIVALNQLGARGCVARVRGKIHLVKDEVDDAPF